MISKVQWTDTKVHSQQTTANTMVKSKVEESGGSWQRQQSEIIFGRLLNLSLFPFLLCVCVCFAKIIETKLIFIIDCFLHAHFFPLSLGDDVVCFIFMLLFFSSLRSPADYRGSECERWKVEYYNE